MVELKLLFTYKPTINVKSNNDLLDILEDYESSSNNLTASVKTVEKKQ